MKETTTNNFFAYPPDHRKIDVIHQDWLFSQHNENKNCSVCNLINSTLQKKMQILTNLQKYSQKFLLQQWLIIWYWMQSIKIPATVFCKDLA